MNSNDKIAYVLGLIGVVVLFILLIDTSNDTNKPDFHPKFSSSNWSTKFGVENKNPLGLSIFNSLLDVHLEKKNKIQKIRDWKHFDSLVVDKKKSTYLFIGESCELLNEEIDTILESVNQGSDLVMSFNNLSQNLTRKFFLNLKMHYEYSDSITLFAGKQELVLYNIYQNDTVAVEWFAFDDIEVVDSIYTSLSSFMELDNFIKIPHGKGFIYLHSNPQFFYNYQVLRNDGFKQVNVFLNQFHKDNNVYWLEVGNSNNFGVGNPNKSTGTKDDDSFFKLLFNNPSLLFALLLIILGFILFLLFRAKRLRPLVPYIEKKKNMTLSFADTITSIYFAKESPKGLLKVQQKNFFNTIQKHFFIDLSKRDDDKEIKILSDKSNIPFDEIKDLIFLLENRKANEVTVKYITDVALIQRSFYERTGIISSIIQNRIGKQEKVFNRSLLLPTIFILFGILIVLFGVTLLMNGKGLGIVFWPIGFFLIILGILQLSKPLVAIFQENITFYYVFGKSKSFSLDEIIHIEKISSHIKFNFTKNRELKLHFWMMSRFVKNQFVKSISNFHKLGK